MATSVLETVDRLKDELDQLRPLPPDVVARVEQKLRIASNYHSNAVEGNSLTLGETRSLILHGLTARGKPMRDHLDIQGHDDAVKAIERAVKEGTGLTEVFIRNLHRVLLKEPYETEAMTPDGRRTTRPIALGDYKATPNNVKTSTGEIYYFTPPEQVKPAMTDLLDWYRDQDAAGEHPVIIAAAFHYRFVRIHPFDDGNGRMARLLMNLILIKHGYTVAIVQSDERERYLQELERADQSEDLTEFIDYIASCCRYGINLYLRAARREPIEDPEDIDREIALFRQSVFTRGGASNQIALRQYAEATAHPFYMRCHSKLEALSSGVFAMPLIPYLEFSGTGGDGATFHAGFHIPQAPFEPEKIPRTASQVTINFQFLLKGYRRSTNDVLVRIDNIYDVDDCLWTFRLDGGNFSRKEDYRGQDIDDLNARLNSLLRLLISVMNSWSCDAT